jgi:hypothetical protein
VDGVVVAATSSSFSLEGGATYALAAQTQICHGGCSGSWLDLHPGDRIQASIEDPAGLAQWINVNPWSDWVQVDAVEADRLVVHSTRNENGGSPYTVVIVPETRVKPIADGSSESVGSVPGARTGSRLFVTGSTSSPNDSSVVIATTIST